MIKGHPFSFQPGLSLDLSEAEKPIVHLANLACWLLPQGYFSDRWESPLLVLGKEGDPDGLSCTQAE
jgi:hypothetical protein